MSAIWDVRKFGEDGKLIMPDPTPEAVKLSTTLCAAVEVFETTHEELHLMLDAAENDENIGLKQLMLCKDEKGRTPLHLACTRGDLKMCSRLAEAAGTDLIDCRDEDTGATPLMTASFTGRAMVVKELIKHGADVTLKSNYLMSPLALSVADDGHGSGDVVEALVEAGAEIDARCWDRTPLMVASSSGHDWAVETLLMLGADPCLQGEQVFMPLDYARSQGTAELIWGFMQGEFLTDRAAPKLSDFKHKKESKRRRFFKSGPKMPFPDALEGLDLPKEWAGDFAKTGEHMAEIKKQWRRLALQYHPDKRPDDLTADQEAELTGKFQTVMAAFERLDHHYRFLTEEAGSEGGDSDSDSGADWGPE